MRSRATRRFWKLFSALPLEIQELATKNYQLWRENPEHPSLHFKLLQGYDNLYSVRIGKHYRAIGLVRPDAITWTWIGSHSDDDQIIK